jgi:gamma-glutamyl:cysteine ligase YbdK (ATP-grasp superfamily)
MFTTNYPLLIDHILREAKLYLLTVQRLQNREEVNALKEAYEQELFWNRIMAEHSKFIRGLLDPTEEELFKAADNFGKEFDQLTNEAKQAIDKTIPISKVTDDSLRATQKIREFKTQGTKGILECKVKSIIIPLLGDHTIREASHYLRLLKMFEARK